MGEVPLYMYMRMQARSLPSWRIQTRLSHGCSPLPALPNCYEALGQIGQDGPASNGSNVTARRARPGLAGLRPRNCGAEVDEVFIESSIEVPRSSQTPPS